MYFKENENKDLFNSGNNTPPKLERGQVISGFSASHDELNPSPYYPEISHSSVNEPLAELKVNSYTLPYSEKENYPFILDDIFKPSSNKIVDDVNRCFPHSSSHHSDALFKTKKHDFDGRKKTISSDNLFDTKESFLLNGLFRHYPHFGKTKAGVTGLRQTVSEVFPSNSVTAPSDFSLLPSNSSFACGSDSFPCSMFDKLPEQQQDLGCYPSSETKPPVELEGYFNSPIQTESFTPLEDYPLLNLSSQFYDNLLQPEEENDTKKSLSHDARSVDENKHDRENLNSIRNKVENQPSIPCSSPYPVNALKNDSEKIVRLGDFSSSPSECEDSFKTSKWRQNYFRRGEPHQLDRDNACSTAKQFVSSPQIPVHHYGDLQVPPSDWPIPENIPFKDPALSQLVANDALLENLPEGSETLFSHTNVPVYDFQDTTASKKPMKRVASSGSEENVPHRGNLKNENRVNVTHIPHSWSPSYFYSIFSPYGKILQCDIDKSHSISPTKLRKGFVEYDNRQSALNACVALNEAIVEGNATLKTTLASKFDTKKQWNPFLQSSASSPSSEQHEQEWNALYDDPSNTGVYASDESVSYGGHQVTQPFRTTAFSGNSPLPMSSKGHPLPVGELPSSVAPQPQWLPYWKPSQGGQYNSGHYPSSHPPGQHLKSVFGDATYKVIKSNRSVEENYNERSLTSSVQATSAVGDIQKYGSTSFQSKNRNTAIQDSSRTYNPDILRENNLFVFRIPPQWDEEKFRSVFSQFGPIKSLRFPKDDRTPWGHRGYGFVCYIYREHACLAIREMHERELELGRRLKVEFKKQHNTYFKHPVQHYPHETMH